MAFVSLRPLASSSIARRRNLEEFNLAHLSLALGLLHDRQSPWAPVPATSLRHRQGMSSAAESGVWP
jgi:hypothetical protein